MSEPRERRDAVSERSERTSQLSNTDHGNDERSEEMP